jgi:hypothetical protein
MKLEGKRSLIKEELASLLELSKQKEEKNKDLEDKKTLLTEMKHNLEAKTTTLNQELEELDYKKTEIEEEKAGIKMLKKDLTQVIPSLKKIVGTLSNRNLAHSVSECPKSFKTLSLLKNLTSQKKVLKHRELISPRMLAPTRESLPHYILNSSTSSSPASSSETRSHDFSHSDNSVHLDHADPVNSNAETQFAKQIARGKEWNGRNGRNYGIDQNEDTLELFDEESHVDKNGVADDGLEPIFCLKQNEIEELQTQSGRVVPSRNESPMHSNNTPNLSMIPHSNPNENSTSLMPDIHTRFNPANPDASYQEHFVLLHDKPIQQHLLLHRNINNNANMSKNVENANKKTGNLSKPTEECYSNDELTLISNEEENSKQKRIKHKPKKTSSFKNGNQIPNSQAKVRDIEIVDSKKGKCAGKIGKASVLYSPGQIFRQKEKPQIGSFLSAAISPSNSQIINKPFMPLSGTRPKQSKITHRNVCDQDSSHHKTQIHCFKNNAAKKVSDQINRNKKLLQKSLNMSKEYLGYRDDKFKISHK